MKIHLIYLPLILCGTSLVLSAQGDEKPHVLGQAPKVQENHRKALIAEPNESVASLTAAVLDFESSDEKMAAKGREIAVLLGAQLSTADALWMVERGEIDKILGEQTLHLSGLGSPGKEVKTGQLLGAKVLITGRLIKNGEAMILVAKIMSTETSRVFGETATTRDADSLSDAIAELGQKVMATLVKQEAAFRSKVTTEKERIDAMKKLVEGRNLQPISVKIEERDLSQTTIDPAVETEFKKVLSELGFPVVEASASAPAEVMIRGEAISETGSRRGSLVSARGRAEVQVTRCLDGKLLAVDRETATAVDIAEAVAGKSALQSAALTLLERVVPQLVGE